MELSIKKATPDDIPSLVTLINACFVGEEAPKGWASVYDLIGGIRITPEGLLKDLLNPDITIFKCADTTSGELIASCNARKENHIIWSEMLCVLPTGQGRGVGKLMVQGVEDLARELNCRVHKIEVFSCRKPLIEWYERMGFKENGIISPFPEPEERDWFPKVKLDLIEMEKTL